MQQQLTGGAQAYPPPMAVRGYGPARGRATVAWTLLALRGAASLLVIVALVGRLTLVNSVLNGQQITVSDANASDSFVITTTWLALAVSVLAAIAFLMWLHRIVWNNRELGAMGTRFSPGYAVGCWFIPFANLVLPCLAVREAWKAAADTSPHQSTLETRARVRGAWLVTLWWITWLLADIAMVAAAVETPAPGSAGIAQQLAQQTQISLVAQGVLILAAILGAVVVLRVTALQEGRARLLSAAAALPPPVAGWQGQMQ